MYRFKEFERNRINIKMMRDLFDRIYFQVNLIHIIIYTNIQMIGIRFIFCSFFSSFFFIILYSFSLSYFNKLLWIMVMAAVSNSFQIQRFSTESKSISNFSLLSIIIIISPLIFSFKSISWCNVGVLNDSIKIMELFEIWIICLWFRLFQIMTSL